MKEQRSATVIEEQRSATVIEEYHASKRIKKGLISSIGWNLGKIFKSSHLFDPLTSTPINGTNIRKKRVTKKIANKYFSINSLFWNDIKIIINIESKT